MTQMVKEAREALEKAEKEVGDSPVCAQKVMIACTRALCFELADLYMTLESLKGTIQFTSGRPREISQPQSTG